MSSEQFGNYLITEQLGQSSMGLIYAGHHETLGRRVVVKVLLPELSRNAEMVQRFFKEAQAATAIRNPGIVHIFDYGVTPEGRAYVVTEQLEGQSLEARLKQRRLELAECCRIGRQVANVLQAAHAAGIIHRDLKPENLFLVPDPEVIGGERVKVLDFGLAKLAGEAQADGVKTRTGLMRGSPSYMSPEQCKSLRTADARSDIYALGCIVFEMACGRPPFTGHGMGDILGAHLHLPVPHPQTLAPNLPPELAALLLAMLEKQPDARPQTMTVVSQTIDDIARALEGLPPRSSQPLPVLPSRPPPARAPAPLPGLTGAPGAPAASPGFAATELAAPGLAAHAAPPGLAGLAAAAAHAPPPRSSPIAVTLPPDAQSRPELTLEDPTFLSDGPPPGPTLSTGPTLPRNATPPPGPTIPGRPAQLSGRPTPPSGHPTSPEATLANPTLLPLSELTMSEPTLLPADDDPAPPPPSRLPTPLPVSPSAPAPQPWPAPPAPQPWPAAPAPQQQYPRAPSASPAPESPHYPRAPSAFPGSPDAQAGPAPSPWPAPPSQPPAGSTHGRAQTPWPVPPEMLPPARAQTPWPVPSAEAPPPVSPAGYPAPPPNVAALQRVFLLVGVVLITLIIAIALIAGTRGSKQPKPAPAAETAPSTSPVDAGALDATAAAAAPPSAR